MKVVSLPVSKSILIRKLFINYLYFNKIEPIHNFVPEDVKIVFRNFLLIRTSHSTTPTHPKTIDVKDCGAAYRFFLATLSITQGYWLLTGSQRLLQRPITPLITALRQIGANIVQEENGLRIEGRNLAAKKIQIDYSQSSQFVSALLLIAPIIGLQKIDFLSNAENSLSYIALSCQLLKQVNIKTQLNEKGITLQGKPVFHYIKEESDWSAAAYWYAYTQLSGEPIFFPRLYSNSQQPDKNVKDIFEKMGVMTIPTTNGIIIKQEEIKRKKYPKCINLQQNPDIAPILIVLSVLLKLDIHFTGLGTLNLKESKRLDVLRDELSRFAQIEIEQDSTVKIAPLKTTFHSHLPYRFSSHHDHRMVMAFSLFKLHHCIEIDNENCVRKSYPKFR